MIKPTVGRVVWYRPSTYDQSGPGGLRATTHQPLAAMIVYVHGDTMVNLVIHDCNGNTHARTSVHLHQGEGQPPVDHGYCEWMPYQVGQAKAAT